MRTTRTRLFAATLAVALAVGLVACSDDDDGGSSDTGTETTAAPDGATDEGGAADGAATGDAAAVTLADGEAPPELTVTFTDAGGFSPATLSVGVGELFTFVAGDDGTHAVKFGTSTDTYAISGGLIESFTISAAGTYTVTEDLTSQTMTITVG